MKTLLFFLIMGLFIIIPLPHPVHAQTDTVYHDTAKFVPEILVSDTMQTDTLLANRNTGQVLTTTESTGTTINYAALVLGIIVTFGGIITGLVANIKYLSTTVPAVLTSLALLYNQATASGGLQNIGWNEILITSLVAVFGIYLPGIEWGQIFQRIFPKKNG